jgi:IMP dehydrogenase
MIIKEALSFDDVLLIPKYSNVTSRSEVDTSVTLTKGFKFATALCPSNMKTVTELAMARFMYKQQGLALFHRFTDFKTQLEWLKEIQEWGSDATKFIGFSVGVKEEAYTQVDTLVKNGCKIICVDVAHGNSSLCINMTKYIAKKYPNVLLISGNVAMGDGAKNLWEAGADMVKVGIGAGGICTTRVSTGNGVASITSLISCNEMRSDMESVLNRKLFLMQDGGCKTSGDVSKSLCYADMVMAGGLFAGTDEAAPEIVEINGVKYKPYAGSSTYRGAHREGVEGYKKYKGPVLNVLKELTDGISSCCSYQGVYNLHDLKKNPNFVKITPAGLRESHSHDLDITVK